MNSAATVLLIVFVIVALFAIGALVLVLLHEKGAPPRPIYRSPAETKGALGEEYVKLFLEKHARPEERVLNDIILFNAQTRKSAQIDHIYLSTAGIFVIETKTYAGMIFGTEEAREWTEVLADGRIKNKFYSPFKQNSTHVRLVSKIVRKRLPIINIVVFVQGNLTNVHCPNVFSLKDFYAYIRGKTETIVTPKEIDMAYRRLIGNRDSYAVTPEEHIANIHKTQEDIANGICPRCGGKLVPRTGHYSVFYGCSNYPKCKFKKKS